MIVRSVQNGWEIILQSAHCLLAGRIAECLKFDPLPPFWFETNVAITEHDDFKQQFIAGEREYLTEAGAPLDFAIVAMTDDQRVIENRRRLDNAYRKHRWIGLLQSMHVEKLYGDADGGAAMTKLLDEQRSVRQRVVSELHQTQDDLQKAYDWMRFCDRLSLILCQQETPAMGRKLELITNSEEVCFMIAEGDQGSLQIEPWPFRREQFKVKVESRVLPQLEFTDDGELGNAIMKAPVEVKEFGLRRQFS